MKKLCIFLLSFLSLSGISFAASFNDIASSHQNFNAIEYLKEKGIINGFSDGSFKPDNKVNRAEAIKIIVEAFSVSKEKKYAGEFNDVKVADWFSEYVAAGKNAGIVNGYADGSFKPGNTLLLSEALKIVLIGAKVAIPSNLEKDVFSDVRSSDWYAPFALYAREKNIILGDDFGKISPGAEISRAEFSELIFRILKIKENGEAPFDLAFSWPKFESAIGFSMKYNAPRWKVLADKSSVTFYNPDIAYGELSARKVYTNSAKIMISIDSNTSKQSAKSYFDKLKSSYTGFESRDFTFKGMTAIEFVSLEKRAIDWYLYSSSGEVFGVFTEYGAGVLAFQYPKEIAAMINSIEIGKSISVSSDKDKILGAIFANILIKGKGMASLSTLPDKTIIETDTIGVGTGAVDYYYCESYDITFKYERADDLILDKREGKTTAF